MRSHRFSLQRFVATLAATGLTVTGIQAAGLTEGLPGLTIFSGVARENQLGYRLDFGGRTNAWDRWILRIPSKKMKIAVAQFAIDYPDYFNGTFNPKEVEIKVKGKKIKLQEVKWDKDGRVIEIFPVEPVPANSSVEVILSDVKNPSSPGTFYFNCRVLSPGDVPLLRDVGTWIVSID